MILIDKYKPYLNLGCGIRYHRDWINIDRYPFGENIHANDFLSGIAIADEQIEFLYMSHVLEHIERSKVHFVIRECHRVLKDNGIIRIVVPDFEKIAKQYLCSLENAVKGDKVATILYDWNLLLMFDQLVSNNSGGLIIDFLSQNNLIDNPALAGQIDSEFRNILKNKQQTSERNGLLSTIKSISRNIRIHPGYYFFKKLNPFLYIREILLRLLLLNDYRILEAGRYRISGHVHQWMYDRFSITRLLKNAGFASIKIQSPQTSYLRTWKDIGLDIEKGGAEYKFGSLYVEAIKIEP